jgi:hypothetical protein
VTGASFEIQGLSQLSADLGKAAVAALPAVRAVAAANGEHLAQTWRDNAKATAGKHGKWYPSSITSEQVAAFGAAVVDVGPESARKQGAMGPGFEYGSVNQPPHLDGKRALDEVEPKLLAELEAAAAGLL